MKKRSRGAGYVPAPEEIKALRGDKNQAYIASLLYCSERCVRQWEAGKTRMHPLFWEALQAKIKA